MYSKADRMCQSQSQSQLLNSDAVVSQSDSQCGGSTKQVAPAAG